MKNLIYNDEIYEAEQITKTSNAITGYIYGKKSWEIGNITDFSPYSLADGQQWDLVTPTENQILENEITELQLALVELYETVLGGA